MQKEILLVAEAVSGEKGLPKSSTTWNGKIKIRKDFRIK